MYADTIRDVLSNGVVLLVWTTFAVVSLVVLVRDFRASNTHIDSLMKAVWFMTVLYSGPVDLWLY